MPETTEKASGFSGFWPYYLRAHMDPRTRAVHYAGTVCGTLVFLAGLVFGPWWLLLLGIAIGYGMAVPTHPIIEGNRPATLVSPHFSLLGDFYMLYLFIIGRLGPELERVRRLRDLAGHGIAPQGRETDKA